MTIIQPRPDEVALQGTRWSETWYRWTLAITRRVNGAPELPEHTIAAGLPSAALPCKLIFVSDAGGGAVPCFSDGADWRRVTDQTVVS